MEIDFEKLEERLPLLTGRDYIACESAVANSGTIVNDARFNSAFQARLAALALEIPAEEIFNLPMNDFKAVTQRVFNFFFQPSATKIPAKSS